MDMCTEGSRRVSEDLKWVVDVLLLPWGEWKERRGSWNFFMSSPSVSGPAPPPGRVDGPRRRHTDTPVPPVETINGS